MYILLVIKLTKIWVYFDSSVQGGVAHEKVIPVIQHTWYCILHSTLYGYNFAAINIYWNKIIGFTISPLVLSSLEFVPFHGR